MKSTPNPTGSLGPAPDTYEPTTRGMSATERNHIERLHRSCCAGSPECGHPTCSYCKETWPCQKARLIEQADSLERQREVAVAKLRATELHKEPCTVYGENPHVNADCGELCGPDGVRAALKALGWRAADEP